MYICRSHNSRQKFQPRSAHTLSNLLVNNSPCHTSHTQKQTWPVHSFQPDMMYIVSTLSYPRTYQRCILGNVWHPLWRRFLCRTASKTAQMYCQCRKHICQQYTKCKTTTLPGPRIFQQNTQYKVLHATKNDHDDTIHKLSYHPGCCTSQRDITCMF